MKYLVLVFLIGCGGIPVSTVSLEGTEDPEVAGSVDTESPPDIDSSLRCERACAGFDFTSCISVITKVLPVGKFLSSRGCFGRCEELVRLYEDLEEEVDFRCTERSASCPAVAVCFGVKE